MKKTFIKEVSATHGATFYNYRSQSLYRLTSIKNTAIERTWIQHEVALPRLASRHCHPTVSLTAKRVPKYAWDERFISKFGPARPFVHKG